MARHSIENVNWIHELKIQDLTTHLVHLLGGYQHAKSTLL